MNLGLLLRMAALRLIRFRLQTALLAVGIVVSICATTLVVIALANMRDRFGLYFSKLYPSDAIVLESNYSPEGGIDNAQRLKTTEVESIVNSTPQIVDWDPLVYAGQKNIKVGRNAVSALVTGHSERAEHIRDRPVSDGEYFSAADIRGRAKVVLIGSSIATTLFPGQSPIGGQIAIDGVQFSVKGVLQTIGVDPHGNNQDDFIQVPYTTLMQHVMKIDYLSSVMFVLDDRTHMPQVVELVSGRLRELHPQGAATGQDFHITTPRDMQRRMDESFRTVETFVTIAATAGYVLSGVVILIVMLMSIKSRTAEIGLRKAVGARRGDVHWQILFEAIIVAATASVSGLILAQLLILLAAPLLVSHFGLVMDRIPVATLGFAVAAALLTAILSALLPARRAAALDPVVALRQL